MSAKNKELSRRIVEEAFTKGNLDVVDELVADSYVGYDPTAPEPIRGPAGLKEFISMYRSAFPDMRISIDDQIAEGDRVVTRWRAEGTHKGELMGIAPTGKQATVEGITIDRIKNDKIAESYDNWDTLGLLQQLGAVPALAQA